MRTTQGANNIKRNTMKTVEIKIYGITELSEDAQQTALNKWCEIGDYPFENENVAVIEEFCNEFELSYSFHRDSVNVTVNNEPQEEITGHRLAKYLWNNFEHILYTGKYYSKFRKIGEGYISRRSKILKEENTLTGYCIGNDILQPLFKFLKEPCEQTTFKELMLECVQEWERVREGDVEFYFSLDNFIETSEANEWEYTEDGKQF
jgi:hypothetical protein